MLFIDQEKVLMEKFQPIPNEGVLIVGQESDKLRYGGGFNALQAFSGKITQFEIWNKALSPNDIETLAKCQNASVLEANRIVTWLSDQWINNNVDIVEVPLPELCQENPTLDKVVWPDLINYYDFKEMCDKLGGQLPTFNSNGEEEYHVMEENFEIIKQMIPYNISDTCYVNPEKVMHWVGMNRINTPHWSNPYNLTQNFDNFKVKMYDMRDRKCAYLKGDLGASFCHWGTLCGVCHLPSEKVIYLKGLCVDDSDKLYDIKYYVHGLENGRPYFR